MTQNTHLNRVEILALKAGDKVKTVVLANGYEHFGIVVGNDGRTLDIHHEISSENVHSSYTICHEDFDEAGVCRCAASPRVFYHDNTGITRNYSYLKK